MRPLLLIGDDASNWLWPGARSGSHKSNAALSDQITRRVRSDLGLAVNPHLYRHLAAWFYLQARPGDYETIRRLLGHKSIQTTISYYIEIDQIMISRSFNTVLDELRIRPLPR
jgi:integrase